MTNKDTYTIFIIQGYSKQIGVDFDDLVLIELIDTSADSALERAEALVKCKHYRVAHVIENMIALAPAYVKGK